MRLTDCIERLPPIAGMIAITLLAACAERAVPLPSPSPPQPPPQQPPAAVAPSPPAPVATEQAFFTQNGVASWYGGYHHGRRTASGERFNMNAMTAAHRTLGMSTVLRVTNLENGRTVRVRINDRGPFVRGRIIDLSAAAAQALGMKRAGLARVRIDAFASDQPDAAAVAGAGSAASAPAQ